MYRCGFPIAAITAWGQDALARTGGRDPAANLTRDLSEQVRDFAKRAAEPKASAWAVAAHGVLRDTPGLQECQADALARFIIIIARSKHLMREGGGQLSFADISILLGMPTTNVVSWRLTLESSGLLNRWGSDRSTHYALNIKEVANG